MALGVFDLLFQWQKTLLTDVYLVPMVQTARFLLASAGVDCHYDDTGLSRFYCDLHLNQVAYRVKHECTGLFASGIYVSSVIAYPAGIRKKVIGAVTGFSAFYVFGLFRILIMAAVALLSPAHIPLFHVYIMVVVSLGFAVAIWMFWIQR